MLTLPFTPCFWNKLIHAHLRFQQEQLDWNKSHSLDSSEDILSTQNRKPLKLHSIALSKIMGYRGHSSLAPCTPIHPQSSRATSRHIFLRVSFGFDMFQAAAMKLSKNHTFLTSVADGKPISHCEKTTVLVISDKQFYTRTVGTCIKIYKLEAQLYILAFWKLLGSAMGCHL